MASIIWRMLGVPISLEEGGCLQLGSHIWWGAHNTRDLGTGVLKTRGCPYHCDSGVSRAHIKSIFHFTISLAASEIFPQWHHFFQLSTNENGKKLCHRRNISLAASEIVKWKTCFISNLGLGCSYYFIRRSFARGLGIATLTIHHGTVLGDGCFVWVQLWCNQVE